MTKRIKVTSKAKSGRNTFLKKKRKVSFDTSWGAKVSLKTDRPLSKNKDDRLRCCWYGCRDYAYVRITKEYLTEGCVIVYSYCKKHM